MYEEQLFTIFVVLCVANSVTCNLQIKVPSIVRVIVYGITYFKKMGLKHNPIVS